MKTLTNSDVSDVMFFKQYFCNFLNASSKFFLTSLHETLRTDVFYMGLNNS